MLRIAACASAATILLAATSGPARAAQEGAHAARLSIKPILDARLRSEQVEQELLQADALTLRLRPGAEVSLAGWSVLAEAEATLAPVDDYNAFPFLLTGEEQSRPGHAVVADPRNLELNRLQIRHTSAAATVTLGRQRINLDDQRWVGSVGWRQNEQTFDALNIEARLGPASVDLVYANSQRTIYGADSGDRAAYRGDFLFAGLASRPGSVRGKLFAYLLDYDEPFFLANSSQTYGGFVTSSVPLRGDAAVNLRASYARQSDYGANPADYAANYWNVEGGTNLAGFAVTAGWEQLGSDRGRSVQTPMATLHKFNGWADVFLVTPPAGLEDVYVSVGRRFEEVGGMSGLNATIAFHQFDSVRGNLEYGTEWDAAIGFTVHRVGILLKYADFAAKGWGVDTRKLWLEASWSL